MVCNLLYVYISWEVRDKQTTVYSTTEGRYRVRDEKEQISSVKGNTIDIYGLFVGVDGMIEPSDGDGNRRESNR